MCVMCVELKENEQTKEGDTERERENEQKQQEEKKKKTWQKMQKKIEMRLHGCCRKILPLQNDTTKNRIQKKRT